jgi:methyl-accepting chemotaxis protein
MVLVNAARRHLSTLRFRLSMGLLVLLLLIAAATWIGYATVGRLTDEINERFATLRASSQIGAELEGLILDQMTSAEAYLARPAPAEARTFEQLGRRAHELRRRYRDLPDLSDVELTQIEAVEGLHSALEVDYALAHALLDLGRPGEAGALAAQARPSAQELQQTIRRVSAGQADKVATASAELERMGRVRQSWLLSVLLVALALGGAIILATLRGITVPLQKLIDAARQVGEGDLRIELNGRKMPTEFRHLSYAFNSMAGQLRTLVSETVTISEQISVSASDLSSISEQVAASSGEVATAMIEITGGAESQSHGLRTTTSALTAMARRADEIGDASSSVTTLSEQIHRVAAESRSEVSHALRTLLEVREVVHASGQEVTELERASRQIDRFVETISGIARQTNLLALNAAIEAARAGEHGRGFAVVADEVRKLAEGSARAADEVAGIVREIRGKIEGVAATMERGTEKVADVEEVSKGADAALEQILVAVDGVRQAVGQVAEAVERSHASMRDVESSLTHVSGTAESHAASAQEVSAAAEEQSAATEEMSATSAQLLESAERMRELVSGLRV